MVSITRVRTITYSYRMNRKIGDVHFPEGSDLGSDMAVLIDTDEGVTGVSVGYGQGAQAVDRFSPLLVGEDPRSVRGLWHRMVSQNFKLGNVGPAKIAVAALDVALWDLRAKLNELPLWKELGAGSGEATAYASGLDTPLSDEELAAFYRRMASRGINAGKLKVGLDQDADLRRLDIMRDALATSNKNPILMIDSNEYWTPKQSIRRIREMEREFDLVWVEEPAGRRDAVGLRKVSSAVSAAVATGENLDNAGDFANLIREEAVDVVQIGVLAGGITGALQIAELADAFGLPVAMMNCPGRYMAHLAAALPNHFMMEVVDCGRDSLFSQSPGLEDGKIILGDEPGIGIVFDEETLAGSQAEGAADGSLRSMYRRSPTTWVDEYRHPTQNRDAPGE